MQNQGQNCKIISQSIKLKNMTKNPPRSNLNYELLSANRNQQVNDYDDTVIVHGTAVVNSNSSNMNSKSSANFSPKSI